MAVGEEDRRRAAHHAEEPAVGRVGVHEPSLRLVDRSDVGERVHLPRAIARAPRRREAGGDLGDGAVGHAFDERVAELGRPLAARRVGKGVEGRSLPGIHDHVLLRVAVAAAVIFAVIMIVIANLGRPHDRDPVGRRESRGISEVSRRERTVAVKRAHFGIAAVIVRTGIDGIGARARRRRDVVVAPREVPGGGEVGVVAAVPHGLRRAEIRRAVEVVFVAEVHGGAVGLHCGCPADFVELAVAVEGAGGKGKLLRDLAPAHGIEALGRIRELRVHQVGHPADLRDVAVAVVVEGAGREPALLVERGMVQKCLAEGLDMGECRRRLGRGLHSGEVRQQQPEQDADDGDRDEQLDERETM